mmetsp:Transcript_4042/g.9166  ORF Transcript_4042/g.9166 Transcript_4042/m.9166 type:complete len:223 (+) Transcript_4042:1497-2165(+)
MRRNQSLLLLMIQRRLPPRRIMAKLLLLRIKLFPRRNTLHQLLLLPPMTRRLAKKMHQLTKMNHLLPKQPQKNQTMIDENLVEDAVQAEVAGTTERIATVRKKRVVLIGGTARANPVEVDVAAGERIAIAAAVVAKEEGIAKNPTSRIMERKMQVQQRKQLARRWRQQQLLPAPRILLLPLIPNPSPLLTSRQWRPKKRRRRNHPRRLIRLPHLRTIRIMSK